MTETMAQRLAEPDAQLNRRRCPDCSMPLRGSSSSCWACGLDAAIIPRPELLPPEPEPEPTRGALLVMTLMLLLVAVIASIALVPTSEGHGVRGLAARLRGDVWVKAGLPGATAEFPTRPAHFTAPAGAGYARPAEVLAATAAGLRVELRASATDPSGGPADELHQLVVAYLTNSDAALVRLTPVRLPAGAALDAVLDGSGGPTHLRALTAGSHDYLIIVTGPAATFERFTGSFTATT